MQEIQGLLALFNPIVSCIAKEALWVSKMSHPEQEQFVKLVRQKNNLLLQRARVLEIGSYDVYGGLRQIFHDAYEYIGIDLCPGPGVDVVANAHDLPDLKLGLFDVVISCEVFEHDVKWRSTLRHCINSLKPGGMMIVSCATTLRPEHGTTRSSPSESPGTQSVGWDHYQNVSESELLQELERYGTNLRSWAWTNERIFDLYAVLLDVREANPAIVPSISEIREIIDSTGTIYRIVRWPIRLIAVLFGASVAEEFGRMYWKILSRLFSKRIRTTRE